MVINLITLLVRVPGHWLAATGEGAVALGRVFPEYPYAASPS